MNFRTELRPKLPPQSICLDDKILSIGSCFSDEIGGYLEDFKFDILKNPFGVLFNPVSISRFFLPELLLPDAAFCKHNERIFCFFAHSDFYAKSVDELRKKLQMAHQNFWTHVKESNFILLTFGTAWVYECDKLGVVANCHRQPATSFQKRLLSVLEIEKATGRLLAHLPKTAQVILTVSPVRHLRDTLEGNAVSKASLRVAAHQLSQKYTQIHYFPAYELLLDDLRDYRFYASDLLHPSRDAITYIWKKFQVACINQETQDFISKWQKVRQQLSHRPFNSESAAHQQFLVNLRQEIETFRDYVDIQAELEYLKKVITTC